MSEPKISVIIAMYNAERFIRQTLISVFASKFADYEVIVVDDCSTDNSVAEAEKLLPHFNGRLKIFSTQTNSGGAGVPRNIGVKNSAGKYVTFIDNDDMIVPSALADFYDVAENFQADVVCTEKFFVFNDVDGFSKDNLKIMRCDRLKEFVDEPTPATDDLNERARSTVRGEFYLLPWGKLYRRDFLLENRIEFLQMRYGEDGNFGFQCFLLARKYIFIPQITNVHRIRKNSSSQLFFSNARDAVRLWLNVITKNILQLVTFTDSLEVFRRDPQLREELMAVNLNNYFSIMQNFLKNLPPHEVPKVFYDELQNPALDPKGKDIVAAYLSAERIFGR